MKWKVGKIDPKIQNIEKIMDENVGSE